MFGLYTLKIKDITFEHLTVLILNLFNLEVNISNEKKIEAEVICFS